MLGCPSLGNFWLGVRVQLRAMKGFCRRISNVFRLFLAVSVVFSAATLTAQSVDKLPTPHIASVPRSSSPTSPTFSRRMP